VIAQLARHKHFPESAREAGRSGRVVLTFTVNRSGGVTSVSVSGSSGVAVLDQAALAMVRRAQPFPPMPAGAGASTTITTGIRYDLRDDR
jgi:protein TonB